MSKSGEAPFDVKTALRLGGNGRTRLAELATRMERRYGPPRALAIQPECVIASAARRLATSGGAFGPLDPREKKGAIELAWRKLAPWPLAPQDVAAWLRWAESEWTPGVAVTRICTSLLRNYDPDNPATLVISDWLTAREALLWGRFGDFARRWRLVGGAPAVETIALSLAA